MNLRLTEKIHEFYKNHKQFVTYISISVFVTVIDIIVCRISELFLPPVYANTLGFITGFLIQYLLASRHVYNSENVRTLIIFFVTFLIGLCLANTIVYIGREIIFADSNGFLPFAISKGFAIIIPFFVTYFLRNWLIK